MLAQHLHEHEQRSLLGLWLHGTQQRTGPVITGTGYCTCGVAVRAQPHSSQGHLKFHPLYKNEPGIASGLNAENPSIKRKFALAL